MADETAKDQMPGGNEPSLDLQDLAIAIKLLDTAIKRGAYETKELRSVLDVYEKIENFLQYQAQLQAARAENQNNEGEA